MVKQLTDEQKNKIKDLLHQGVESKTVAEYLGVSSRQVAAIVAHITMGSLR
jgi:FixJ family two-component response regulator